MNDLSTSLWITVLGMSLVFGAIVLLWGMMILLTKFTAEREDSAPEPPREADSPQIDSAPQANLKPQIAALAVAIALAEQNLSAAHPLEEPPTAIVSAWQLGMRTRQMSEKGNFRRH